MAREPPYRRSVGGDGRAGSTTRARNAGAGPDLPATRCFSSGGISGCGPRQRSPDARCRRGCVEKAMAATVDPLAGHGSRVGFAAVADRALGSLGAHSGQRRHGSLAEPGRGRSIVQSAGPGGAGRSHLVGFLCRPFCASPRRPQVDFGRGSTLTPRRQIADQATFGLDARPNRLEGSSASRDALPGTSACLAEVSSGSA